MRVPRIGFNIFPYRNTRSGGMLYYALSMLRQFSHKVPDRLTLFCGKHSRKLIRTIDGVENISVREIEEVERIFDYRREFDVLFTPASWGGISMLDYPTIHVLPDIQEHYYPEYFSSAELNHRHIFHPWVSRSSTVLITISDFSKRTIVERFGIQADKVRVTHLAAHPVFSDDSERGIRPSNMPDVRNFLFYPANAWNHKNHLALLDAATELREQHDMRVPVILAGHLLARDFNRVDIRTEIRARKLQDQVFHIGQTSLPALKYLYLNAAALVHPSLFEGFGIPLVEAMSCGCPVIAAKETSIPEVCGECALYFDPRNHVDIAEKIKEFFENPLEAHARRTQGKERALQFNFDRTAEQTLEVIEEAYCLAGEEALAKRIRSGSTFSGNPILSIFVSADAAKSNGTCSELRALRSDLPDLVQVICLCPETRRVSNEACSNCQCNAIEGPEDMRLALNDAAKVANGNYFFFNEITSIPVRSFIYFLADTKAHGPLAELLYGDTYVKDPGTGRIRDTSMVVEDDSGAIETATCSNLSFVVRSDAFLRILNESREAWNSFQHMAHALWPCCNRQRIYRIVNCVSSQSWEADWLSRKLMNRHHAGGYLNGLMATRLGRAMTIRLLRMYRRLPYKFREIILRFWRAARGS